MALSDGMATYSEANQTLALSALVTSIYIAKCGVCCKADFVQRLLDMGLMPVNPTAEEIEAANEGVFTDQCDDFDTLYAAICAGTWEPPV